MNKHSITNITALIITIVGYIFAIPWLLSVGLFALSGALTNWLAVHMLFEKVPGLYGSGVIPNQFSAIKDAIKQLLMQQFFTQENINKLLKSPCEKEAAQNTMPSITHETISGVQVPFPGFRTRCTCFAGVSSLSIVCNRAEPKGQVHHESAWKQHVCVNARRASTKEQRSD